MYDKALKFLLLIPGSTTSVFMIQGSRLIKEHVQCVHYVDIRHVFFGNYTENNLHCSRLHLEAIINQISKCQLQTHNFSGAQICLCISLNFDLSFEHGQSQLLALSSNAVLGGERSHCQKLFVSKLKRSQTPFKVRDQARGLVYCCFLCNQNLNQFFSTFPPNQFLSCATNLYSNANNEAVQ